ncbi:MAG: ABC transporter ATP-binding protein, partial [Lachnospiraceae bacterium]|nr:ABC transporter ATP-binding protein [Lachnospiraceae bacterium]
MEEKKIPVVRVLLSHVKEFKKDSILTPIFMILEVAMEMIIPLLMGAIIDIGVNKGDMKSILLIGLVMVLVALVGLWAGIMGGKCGASASTGFARNLRKAMFRKVQSFSFENIDRFSTSSLVTRLTTDVANVQNAYQMILRIGMRAPTSLIVAMILSFRISPELASVYLIAVFLLAIIIAIITFFVKGIFDRLFKQYDALNNSVQENVSGIRVVKAYVREDHEIKKFGKANGTLYKLSVKAGVIMSLMSPVMMTAVYTSMLVISWLGAHLIVQNTLTTGNLMSLLTYCMNILMSLMMLSFILVMVTMSAASTKRIAEVLEEEPSIQNPRNPVMDVKSGEIVFKNVDFAYGKDAAEDVLTNVNLHIKSGETIGIMGS